MTDSNNIERAAFELWQAVNSSHFDILMAYKYGDADALQRARQKLADAALDALKAQEAA